MRCNLNASQPNLDYACAPWYGVRTFAASACPQGQALTLLRLSNYAGDCSLRGVV